MILPTIIAFTSLDIFDVNFKVYVQEVENKEDCEIDIDHIRIDQLKNRYALSFNKTYDDYEDNPISIFGELETYPIIENERSGIRVATYMIKPIELWVDFFNSLYQMCDKRWNITTEPVISKSGFGFSDFDSIEIYIIKVYRDHGFDEEYYRSGIILNASDNPEIETRRKSLLSVLNRGLPATDRPMRGHPGLDHDELIYRLAKAQEAEDIKEKNPEMTYGEIALKIGWDRGATRGSKIKLLEKARQDLDDADPELLSKVEEYRKKEKNNN